jgi:hypothetical protein
VSTKLSVTLGLKVHIGWAAVVAVGGSPDDPRVLAKTRIDLATTFEEGAVFHMGQELPLEKARAFVRDSELRFAARARAGLKAFIAGLGARVVGAGMVAAAPRQLPPFEAILKAHPLVHAAEGELYRRVFAEAAAELGAAPARVPPDTLASRAAAALALTPARLAARLAALGKASGKPWAADQKQAALVAWLTLTTARG